MGKRPVDVGVQPTHLRDDGGSPERGRDAVAGLTDSAPGCSDPRSYLLQPGKCSPELSDEIGH
jgi:hypothetical protein